MTQIRQSPSSVRAALVGAAIAFAGAAAIAATQATVLGKQVAARADAPSVAPASGPRSLYMVRCAGCHGADAAGTAGYVRDMRRVGELLRVPGGREFMIKVPGVMGSGLSDAEVAAVMNWLLQTLASASRPQEYVPFDAAEVARARAAPMVDVAGTRARLTAQARAQGIALP